MTMSIYETIELFGLTDASAVPDIADDATLAAIADTAVRTLTADLREAGLGAIADSIGWGVVNLLHRQVEKLERTSYEQTCAIKQALAEQDGSEVKDLELQEATERQHRTTELIRALELLREASAGAYAAETGNEWTPRGGSRTGPYVSAAVIDAREAMKAKRERAAAKLNPEGPRILVTGDVKLTDADLVFRTLDRVHAKHPDLVLIHKGSEGAEKIASMWARLRGVDVMIVRTDWSLGRRAPFRANDEMLALTPKAIGCVIFGGAGVAANLAEKAHRAHIKLMTVIEPAALKAVA
jgi:hypothetical protein